MERYTYVCVLTNRNFYPGLCALTYSLQKTGSKYPLHVVIPESAQDELGGLIRRLKLNTISLPDINLPTELLEANTYARWNQTFFKLQIFGLTQFEKIVFLDLDMIVTQNIDDLFEKPHMSAVAAGHCVHKGWTRLNSGLMVIEPDEDLYHRLIHSIPDTFRTRLEQGQGVGDQDVINFCFPDWWEHKEFVLPEVYNGVTFDFEEVCSVLGYQNLRVIHYAEPRKPWNFSVWRMYRHIIFSLCRRRVNRAKMCMKYWWYLMRSCPNYLKYTWH